MKKHTIAAFATTLVLLICAAPASAQLSQARAQMEMVFSCSGSTKPAEVIGWIGDLNGGSIVESNHPEGGIEYTVPNPVHVLGFRATHFSIRSFHGAERDFDIYETIFPDTPFQSIARIAGLTPDAAGNYHQQVGRNHLFLREQGDVTYVTCAMNVHASSLEQSLRKKEKPLTQEGRHEKQ